MKDTRFDKIWKISNLKLAWERLNTSSSNINYKNYYRDLFWYYEMTLDKNLELLSERIKNGSYSFHKPVRFYLPKQSGLQRPFSLLTIEDQIVYQAMANVVVPEFAIKHREYEYKSVFSNIFNKDLNQNIYLFEKWNQGYNAFKTKISENFKVGKIYTAHFDLAAFFDTIDHNSLLSSIIRNNDSSYVKFLLKALKTWSNTKNTNIKEISHSIPQGPLASLVFAEVFLFSLDKFLNEHSVNYSRYVDDIVIQGNSKNEVLKSIVLLEKACKEKGLVPQSNKFEIFIAKNETEAIGKHPSLTNDEKSYAFDNESNLLLIFNKAFTREDFDSTLIRYILKTYDDSSVLFSKIFSEFNNHYEFIVEFCIYLKRFIPDESDSLLSFFKPLILKEEIPYGFVLGEIWQLLADVKKLGKFSPILDSYAENRIKLAPDDEKYGLYKYLSIDHKQKYFFNLGYERNSLFQLLQIRNFNLEITNDYFFYLTENPFLNRSLTELKIVLQNAKAYFLMTSQTPTCEINLADVPEKSNYEIIKYALKEDYDVQSNIVWKDFFNKAEDYKLACKIIYNSSLAINMNKTVWLNLIDNFNDLLIKTFINILKIKEPTIKWPSVIGANHQYIDIGVILTNVTPFTTKYTTQCKTFLKLHQRRSDDLLSHAKGKKSLKPNTFLSTSEQKVFLKEYKTAIQSFIKEIEIYV